MRFIHDILLATEKKDEVINFVFSHTCIFSELVCLRVFTLRTFDTMVKHKNDVTEPQREESVRLHTDYSQKR